MEGANRKSRVGGVSLLTLSGGVRVQGKSHCYRGCNLERNKWHFSGVCKFSEVRELVLSGIVRETVFDIFLSL